MKFKKPNWGGGGDCKSNENTGYLNHWYQKCTEKKEEEQITSFTISTAPLKEEGREAF